MARPIKLSKALIAMQKDLARKRKRIESAAVAVIKRTLEVGKVYVSRELEGLTGYKKALVKKRTVVSVRVLGNTVAGKIIISRNGRLGVLSLKGTKVEKGSGPVRSLTRSKQGRKKSVGRPGRVIYNILGKKITRKAIVITGRSGNKLAAKNFKKDGKYTRLRGARGRRIVKSGRHKGKSYQTGKLYKLTGPSLKEAFGNEEFRLGAGEYMSAKAHEYMIIEFEKKGIFV